MMQTLFSQSDRNRLSPAPSLAIVLSEDLNLVFLTFLAALCFSLATTGLALAPLWTGVLFEIAYVSYAPRAQWYRDRVAGAQSLHDLHNYPLLFMMTSGAVIISAFGFGMHRWFRTLSHSQSWEYGALLWTALFAIYYWFKLGNVKSQTAERVAGLLILLVLFAFAGLAAYFLHMDGLDKDHHSYSFHFLHIVCVAAIGCILLFTDFLLAKFSAGDDRRALLESALIADLPIVFAFAVLIAFAWLHANCNIGNEPPDYLLSGAVTFQLLASNVIFILLQFDLLKKIGNAMD